MNKKTLIPLFLFSSALLAAVFWLPSLAAQNLTQDSTQQDPTQQDQTQQDQDYNIANNELESVEPIEFTSYVGPHARIDSLADIIAIGTSLSENLEPPIQAESDAESNPEVGNQAIEQQSSDYAGKYSVQRILSAGQTQSFGADILSLSEQAGVDHIRNLRHIISGYLQAQYAYEPETADTISTYVTYYNAFYRGDMAYFEQKYSPTVQDVLLPESVGLSTNYAEWAGATQIVIPLSAYAALGQAPSPNLDETGQRDISEYLEENEPTGAREMREDMLGLRQDKLTDDQGGVEDKQQNLEEENRKTQEALDESAAREAEAQNEDEKQEARQQQEELQEDLQGNTNEQNEVDAVQQTIAQRQENLNKERRELQQDTGPSAANQEAQEAKDELPPGAQVELLPTQKNKFFQFYAIDGETVTIVKRSQINSIRSKDYVADEEGYIAVAGEYNITQNPPQGNSNGRRIRLVRMKKNFDFVSQGNEDIHPDSGIWEIDGALYAYLADGGLGRFNMNLELEAQSPKTYIATLNPRSIGGYILVRTAKEFVLLNPVTLQDKLPLE